MFICQRIEMSQWTVYPDIFLKWYFRMLLWLAQFCKRVSRTHLIPISAIRCKNMLLTKCHGNGEGWEMTSHETLLGSDDNKEVARLSPDELTTSSYFDPCRREIPQRPPQVQHSSVLILSPTPKIYFLHWRRRPYIYLLVIGLSLLVRMEEGRGWLFLAALL